MRISDWSSDVCSSDLYGSGKAKAYAPYPGEPADSRFKSLPDWGDVKVTCYDPGYEPFSGPIEPAYDGVICTDVLEHITGDDIPWVQIGRASCRESVCQYV